MSKEKPPKNPAMYLAFKNAFESIKHTEPVEYVINRLQKAPFPGRIPVEKIQAAVNAVSEKNMLSMSMVHDPNKWLEKDES